MVGSGQGFRSLRAGNSRRAAAASSILGVVAAGLTLVGGAYWTLHSFAPRATTAEVITQSVTRGNFTHDVVERGELESSANITVRCEVQSRTAGSNGIKILEIVPEGTIVKKGDFLFKLDDAALQAERTTQEIAVSSAEAAAAQSKNDLEAAIIARKEYEFGEFETEKEKTNGEILVADEMHSRAKDTLLYNRGLARRGYVMPSTVRKSEYDVSKAESDLRVAKTKMNSLTEFTRPKKISELDAKVKTCDAKLKSDEAKLALEQQKYNTLSEQINKCVCNAPVDGQVIYDHDQDRFIGMDDRQIKQGTVVYQQRTIIRLPDPKQMQVVTKIAESRIDLIKPGMKAKIEIEGLPGVELEGQVIKVNEYPSVDPWNNSSIKEFATTVKVLNPMAGLRPGMTAKAAIRVETLPDALQVPIQSVVERQGKHYCLLAGGEIEPREVLIGSTNEKFVVIKDGVSAGERVLMNPRVHLGEVNLADAQSLGEARLAARKSQEAAAPSEQAPPPGGPGL